MRYPDHLLRVVLCRIQSGEPYDDTLRWLWSWGYGSKTDQPQGRALLSHAQRLLDAQPLTAYGRKLCARRGRLLNHAAQWDKILSCHSPAHVSAT